MAWLDDRSWCHPKLTRLSDRAFRVHVSAIAYSSGMSTSGQITPSTARLLGATTAALRELETAGLWDKNGDGHVIHDWSEHNEARERKRARDRQRLREWRQKQQS